MADNDSTNPATEDNQTLTGTGSSDQLSGAFGNDNIDGGGGDDVLRGDGPIEGTWHFEAFDYNFSSADGQAFDFGGDPSERAASGYVTDLNEGALEGVVRGSTANQSDFGIIYTSTLNITADGTYTFATRSDDGSTIQIFDSSGNPVDFTQGGSTSTFMNNDFHQPATTRSGEVTLDSDETYTIQIRFWENQGGDELSATVSGPGIAGTVDLVGSGLIGVPPGPEYSTTGVPAGVEGDDVISGGAGNDNIEGNGGDDTLSGDEGDDTIDGGSGADTIFGGTGDDTIDGGDGNDTIEGGKGDDTIDGGTGDDTIAGSTGDDTIDGGAGEDTIDGGAGLDLIDGGDDDDIIAGGEGSDVITGGDGDDTIFGDEFLPAPGSDFYYVGNAYIVGENFEITGTGDFAFANVSEFDILTDPVTIRFLDDDVILEGDDGNNEFPEDLTQSVEIDGVEYTANIDYTQTFQDAAGTEYNFIILDIDFDGDGSDNDPGEDGYVLIQIGGPVIPPGTTLDALGGFVNISSIDYADLVRTTVFDDTIDGGDGNDTIDGERGDDTITVGLGDNATGGADADTFTLDFDQTSSTGSTTINIDGSTTEQDGVDNDSLDLTGFGAFTVTETVDADGDSTSGTATYANGNTVNFTEIENLAVCFSKGTQIKVEDGIRAIEALKVGDKLVTHDSGLQAIRWIGERTLVAEKLNAYPKLRPIRIKAGALGDGIPSRDLIVSPQHRIVVRSKIAIRMFEAQEVFVPAKHLLELQGVSIAEDMADVTYFHLLCDNHEIIEAEGALAETLYTGTEAMKAMTPEALEEITLIFGDLPLSDRPLARFTPKGQLAKKLVERHVKNSRAMYS